MSISFIQSQTFDPATSCSICLEPLDDTQAVVTHGNTTAHHQFHKKCLLVWLQQNPTCPICRCPVTNIRKLMSCGEKVQLCANRIKQALQNHPIAVGTSAMIATTGLGLSIGWVLGSWGGMLTGWVSSVGINGIALCIKTCVERGRERRANQVYVLTQEPRPQPTLAPMAVQPATPATLAPMTLQPQQPPTPVIAWIV